MQATVFSHIIQKRFSRTYEDVATDALAFILNSHESARDGVMGFIRSVAPGIPDLRFQTQDQEDGSRPDMRGYDSDNQPRVLFENKFWAGLTDNQPGSYLNILAKYTQPTILFVVVPEDREQSMLRELAHRLNLSPTEFESTLGGVVHTVRTAIGPILAITSWEKLLIALDRAVRYDAHEKNDILQLRSLCESADSDAFLPMSSEEVTDIRLPAFVLQLRSVVQASVERAITEGVLDINGLMPQHSWDRIGRYARFSDGNGVGIWFGIHFELWRKLGGTPLWLVFSTTSFGRSHEVRRRLEPWAKQKKCVLDECENGELVVAIDVPLGEERAAVVKGVVERLKEIAVVLSSLQVKPAGQPEA